MWVEMASWSTLLIRSYLDGPVFNMVVGGSVTKTLLHQDRCASEDTCPCLALYLSVERQLTKRSRLDSLTATGRRAVSGER